MITRKKMTFFCHNHIFSTSPTKKVPCKLKCLSPFFYYFILIIFFSFSSGCDRYVENDDECCNITFLFLIFTENVADFLQFHLAVSAIGREYLWCKQEFSIPPIT